MTQCIWDKERYHKDVGEEGGFDQHCNNTSDVPALTRAERTHCAAPMKIQTDGDHTRQSDIDEEGDDAVEDGKIEGEISSCP